MLIVDTRRWCLSGPSEAVTRPITEALPAMEVAGSEMWVTGTDVFRHKVLGVLFNILLSSTLAGLKSSPMGKSSWRPKVVLDVIYFSISQPYIRIRGTDFK